MKLRMNNHRQESRGRRLRAADFTSANERAQSRGLHVGERARSSGPRTS